MKKILILLMMAVMAVSCSTIRYIEVPVTHTVISHQRDTLIQKDSIYVHDSVAVTHWGDTVHVDRYHILYRDRWRDRVRIDSFIQHDTVTVVKEVTKPPNAWEKTKLSLKTILWVLVIMVILGVTIKLRKVFY